MPTPLESLFELRKGSGDKYRWSALTLSKGPAPWLARWLVRGPWQICAKISAEPPSVFHGNLKT